MIIYLHGLNSSALSEKACLLGDYCGERQIAYTAPTLPHRPSLAINLIRGLLAEAEGESHTIIGSSMGGFYATYLCEHDEKLRAVLINPALNLAAKLQTYVGEAQHNYHNGETYTFSSTHINELQALTVSAITRPQRYWLMVQTGDAILDYREATAYYQGARQTVEEGGDHSYVDFVNHIPAIIDFAKA